MPIPLVSGWNAQGSSSFPQLHSRADNNTIVQPKRKFSDSFICMKHNLFRLKGNDVGRLCACQAETANRFGEGYVHQVRLIVVNLGDDAVLYLNRFPFLHLVDFHVEYERLIVAFVAEVFYHLWLAI